MPKQIKVYLCGPIDGVPPGWATGWRKTAAAYLGQYNIQVLDPTDGKDLYAPGVNDNVYTPAQIVSADLAAIKTADMLLLDWRKLPLLRRIWNFITTGHSDPLRVGSIMEVHYAKMHRKPVIAFGHTKQGYWMRYCVDLSFESLEQALYSIVRSHHHKARQRLKCTAKAFFAKPEE